MDNADKIKSLGIYDLSDVPYTILTQHLLEILDIDFYDYPSKLEDMPLDILALVVYVIFNKADALTKIYENLGYLQSVEEAKKDITPIEILNYKFLVTKNLQEIKIEALKFTEQKYINKNEKEIKLIILDYWKKNVKPFGNIEYVDTDKDKKKAVKIPNSQTPAFTIFTVLCLKLKKYLLNTLSIIIRSKELFTCFGKIIKH